MAPSHVAPTHGAHLINVVPAMQMDQRQVSPWSPLELELHNSESHNGSHTPKHLRWENESTTPRYLRWERAHPDAMDHTKSDPFKRQVSPLSPVSIASSAQSLASVWTAFSEDDEALEELGRVELGSLRHWARVVQPSALRDRYKLQEHLGKGSFASVLVAQDLGTREKFAIKILPLAALKAQGLVDADNESLLTGSVQHPNIVSLVESFVDEQKMYLVMELYKGGDLYELVKNWTFDPDEHYCRTGLPAPLMGKYLFQMLCGLAYLHHNHIVHRDIKCENYIIKSRRRGAPIKLVDFGFACTVQPGNTLRERIGTPLYMAPEIMHGAYNEKCDLWAIGVCTFFMCTSSFPFGDESMTQAEISAIAATGKPSWNTKEWRDVPDELADLVKRLFSLHGAERPSAKAAMAMKWINQMGSTSDQDSSRSPFSNLSPRFQTAGKGGCCVLS